MRRKTVYKYIANDGTLFDSEEACKNYEENHNSDVVYKIRMAYFETDSDFIYAISCGYIGDYKHIAMNYNNFYFPTDEDAKAFNDLNGGFGDWFKCAGLYVDSGGSYQIHAADIIESNEDKIYALRKENEKLEEVVGACARKLEEDLIKREE